MSVLDDFSDLMPHDVRVYPLIGRDEFGAAVYATTPSVATTGRHVHKSRLVRRDDGSEVVSSSFVTLKPVDGITAEAKVTVDGVVRPVLAIERAPDETGQDYYLRVRFQ